MKYENGTWEIVDTFTNEVLAYTNGTSHIPIGMNQWHFPQSKCSDEGKDYRTLSFHKYVEQPTTAAMMAPASTLNLFVMEHKIVNLVKMNKIVR